jgi:hypothetical protein
VFRLDEFPDFETVEFPPVAFPPVALLLLETLALPPLAFELEVPPADVEFDDACEFEAEFDALVAEFDDDCCWDWFCDDGVGVGVGVGGVTGTTLHTYSWPL